MTIKQPGPVSPGRPVVEECLMHAKKVKKLDCHLHDHLFLTGVLHLFFNIII